MSSMVFLGQPTCRNEEWLRLCVEFSINVFETSLTLRMLPPFTHPIVARLLPARRRIQQNIRDAQRLLAPLLENFQQRSTTSVGDKGQLPTMLEWMLENGTASETRTDRVACRQLVLTLASIYSTSSTVSQALFDLCAHPEYFKPLQEEVKAVQEISGGFFKKEHLSRLELLDSFLAESQRLNPLILCQFVDPHSC